MRNLLIILKFSFYCMRMFADGERNSRIYELLIVEGRLQNTIGANGHFFHTQSIIALCGDLLKLGILPCKTAKFSIYFKF